MYAQKIPLRILKIMSNHTAVCFVAKRPEKYSLIWSYVIIEKFLLMCHDSGSQASRNLADHVMMN